MRLARSATTHLFQAVLEGAIIASLVVVLIAGTAFAAKGGGGGNAGNTGGSTLAVKMVIDNNGNGAPNWNDVITFNVSTTATTPTVVLDCYQNGAYVYTASAGFYPAYPWPPNYRLASTAWTGGAATCKATLETFGSRGKVTVLGTLSFDVGA